MPKLLAIWLFLSAFVLTAWSQKNTGQNDDSLKSVLLNIKEATWKTFNGKVTDLTGLPLGGANVILMGTKIGVAATADGSFTIIAKPGNVLEISFAGYISRQIELGKENSITASLSQVITNLDEVLVTGYTAQKVKEITGSIAIVKPKDLTAVPGGQVEQMLQGRVAGLNVITSGMPGGGSNVRLHGIGNFGDVTPLYVIDGIRGDINNLNPDDVESLQVLKDAGAYAIYGVRGSNGVIVITTKKGKGKKPTISYNFYIGEQIPLENGVNYLSPQETADLAWLRYKNSGFVNLLTGNPSDLLYGNGPVPILPDYIVAGRYGGFFEGDPAVNPSLYNLDYTKGPVYQIVKGNKTGTDWFHELFRPAMNQNHTLTISGANDKNHYLFSFGYLNQQGTLSGTYLKRYTVRVNTECNVNSNIRIGENIQLTYRDNPKISNNDFSNNPIQNISDPDIALAILPVHDIMGNWATTAYPGIGVRSNPLGERVLSKNNVNNSWEIFGNAYAEADVLKYFTARTSFGGTITNYYFNNYDYGSFDPLAGHYNSLNESAGYRGSWTWTNTLRFSKIFAKDHTIKVLIGTEAISSYNREMGAGRSQFLSSDPNYRVLSNGVSAITTYGFAGQSALFSYISRLDYGFQDKYFFAATLRRDGSSVFAAQSRYGWFPSVSAAWRITQENLFKNHKWLTNLRLRASWGITGFDGNTDPANQFTLFGSNAGRSYYDLNGSGTRPLQGFFSERKGNSETSWQQDVVTNIGLDGTLWNGKLSISADWYRKVASGLLFPLGLDVILAGDAISPNVNVGNLLNTGMDVLLGSKGRFSKNWNWDIDVTLSAYKNKITHLNDRNYFDGFAVRNEAGYPAGQFYGYEITGIFKDSAEVSKFPAQDAAAPGKFKYLDANGDGTVSDADRVFIGNPNPTFTLGINIALNYKNFDLSGFFFGSFGNDLLNIINPHGGSRTALYDSWTPQHTNTKIPIAVYNPGGDFSTFGTVNTFMIEKGTYLRNKSLVLGYTFTAKWLQRFKIDGLRIYTQALNLFTITKYSGLDPEMTGAHATGNHNMDNSQNADFGIEGGNYPNNQKQYLIGLNLNF